MHRDSSDHDNNKTHHRTKKDKDMEQKYKILVVDDEQDLLEILKFNL